MQTLAVGGLPAGPAGSGEEVAVGCSGEARVRRGPGRVAVTAVVAAASLLWPWRPAGANPRGGCPLGRICLYGGRDFTGESRQFAGDARGGGGLGAGQVGPCNTVDLAVWSAVNRSGPRAGSAGYRLRLFRGADCSQPAATVAPDAGRGDTGGSRSFALECVTAGGCGRRAAGPMSTAGR
jgi:hypothetical protein